MTVDPSASYYPAEEAYARNLALEPLHELWKKRSIKFHIVIWLKGFTCPNDVLESLRVSEVNGAALVCGMDWAEHNGFFIFSDRYVSSASRANEKMAYERYRRQFVQTSQI